MTIVLKVIQEETPIITREQMARIGNQHRVVETDLVLCVPTIIVALKDIRKKSR